MSDYDNYHDNDCVESCNKIWDCCYFFCCYCCIMYKKHKKYENSYD